MEFRVYFKRFIWRGRGTFREAIPIFTMLTLSTEEEEKEGEETKNNGTTFYPRVTSLSLSLPLEFSKFSISNILIFQTLLCYMLFVYDRVSLEGIQRYEIRIVASIPPNNVHLNIHPR